MKNRKCTIELLPTQGLFTPENLVYLNFLILYIHVQKKGDKRCVKSTISL